MCVATICRNGDEPKGLLGKAWRWLARSPLRLLSFSSTVHGLLISALFLLGYGAADPLQWISFSVIFGILSLPLAGYLMSRFPEWFPHSGLHYGWSFATFASGFTSLALIEIGLLTNAIGWLITGSLFLLTAWAIALRGLWWVYKWISLERYATASHLMYSLYGGVVGMTLFLLGVFLKTGALSLTGLLTGALCLWTLATTGTLRLRRQLVSSH